MVKIINYKKHVKENGDIFFSLELQGGIEMVQSKQTGQYYVTAKKTYITTTFDEQTCQGLIGTEIYGSIIKIECEPYEYTVKETGELIILTHSYRYIPEIENKPSHSFSGNKEYIQEELAENHSFSLNEELV